MIWFDINDHFPEYGERVLVTTKDHIVRIWTYAKTQQGRVRFRQEVTAWAHLPEPYTAGNGLIARRRLRVGREKQIPRIREGRINKHDILDIRIEEYNDRLETLVSIFHVGTNLEYIRMFEDASKVSKQ